MLNKNDCKGGPPSLNIFFLTLSSSGSKFNLLIRGIYDDYKINEHENRAL